MYFMKNNPVVCLIRGRKQKLFTLAILALAAFSYIAAQASKRSPQQSRSKITDINAIVLKAVAEMPDGGGYGTPAAGQALIDAIHIGSNLMIASSHAQPSFCTSATYLVFLRTLARLREAGRLNLPIAVLKLLAPPSSLDSLYKDDGKGLWGRWNANGPSTAVMFHQLGIGSNFSDWSKKKPGDFMKIWWTDEVGAKERGHSVIYLGERLHPQTQEPEIQYFSSNRPHGYTRSWVARSRIKHAIFSRLTTPENLSQALSLPEFDAYLASLLKVESSYEEAKQRAGVTD